MGQRSGWRRPREHSDARWNERRSKSARRASRGEDLGCVPAVPDMDADAWIAERRKKWPSHSVVAQKAQSQSASRGALAAIKASYESPSGSSDESQEPESAPSSSLLPHGHKTDITEKDLNALQESLAPRAREYDKVPGHHKSFLREVQRRDTLAQSRLLLRAFRILLAKQLCPSILRK
mmetsp:Transcript_3535/g.9752  ORF Transcript_3535/g.9752 Transcript_3535/m.9752 type:complete len:179 (+) Transcript_3535:120-656(+)